MYLLGQIRIMRAMNSGNLEIHNLFFNVFDLMEDVSSCYKWYMFHF